MENSNPIKYIFATLGCLLVFSLPVVAILAIWDFDIPSIKSKVENVFSGNKSNDMGNYNFEVQAGEDAILTDGVLEDTDYLPRSNPAKKVIIESADIEGPVVHGSDGESLLREGFWLHPASVYPGEIGVSAIFGHRRYHLPPAKDTFYYLDKVKVGDRVEIKLEDGTWLEYSVIETKVIDPSGLNDEINEHSDISLVKFITCTPLGTSNQRLVVVSKRVV
jgi:LPXTG-site transpeptidase (sortase) family protein